MPISYPSSLDNFTNPTSTDLVTSPSHSQQHSDVNDAVEALEAKLGTGSSTPTSGTVLRGTGTGSSAFGAVVLTTDVSGALPIANGGTGSTTAANARTALGLAIGSDVAAASHSHAASDITSGTLAVARGGTGLGSGTSGGILGYTASGTLASSVALTANALVLGGGAGATPTPMGSLGTTTTVLHGNASGAPTFAAVALASDVSGTLPIANGGTGQTTAANAFGALKQDATSSATGVVELAIASEVNTGSDATRAITPDALAGSTLGTKVLEVVAFDFTTDMATGDGKAYCTVPSDMGGMDLVAVHARVITAGTTSTCTIQIANVTQAADMLTTKISIDSAETGSDTAATPPVIDTSNDDVASYDLLRIDVDQVHTTAAKGLIVTLEFRLP